MTIGERLAQAYPLHYQRICEAMNEQSHGTQGWLAQESHDHPLGELVCAFCWAQTSEGWDYWAKLAQVEGFAI